MTRDELKNELRGYTCDRCVLRAEEDVPRWCFYYNERPEENACCNITLLGDKETGGIVPHFEVELRGDEAAGHQVEYYLKIREKI